ncbi:MAG: protein kinase family protein [Candidatus Uhrbacteria bacterium]
MADVRPWLPAIGGSIVSPTGAKYEVGGPLGQGGFGAVRECIETHTGLELAAKFAKPKGTVADVQRRWDAECRLMLEVDSPHIIRLHDFFRYRNVYWMVMERAETTLRGRINQLGPLGDSDVARGGAQLLRGLRELYVKNIVHRDLHIDNILWSVVGRVGYLKIADFGIATQLMYADAVATTRIGRAYDVAPDLHLEGYSTHQSDLYQVGLAMYFMYQGREALSQADGAPREAILSGVARQRAENIGTPLGDFVSVLLRRRAMYRFADADEALVELALVADRQGSWL